MKKMFIAVVIFLVVFGFVSCQRHNGKEGPAEKMGAKIDQTMSEMKRDVEETADRVIKRHDEGTVERVGKRIDSWIHSAKDKIQSLMDSKQKSQEAEEAHEESL